MSTIRILGIPLDLGQRRRGVDMGPSAIRAAGLRTLLQGLGHDVQDCGNLTVVIPETQPMGDGSARFLSEIAETCREVSRQVSSFVNEGAIPIVLGGDHSVAVGTLAGVSMALRAQEHDVGLLWFDAHADMNTPDTTPSGNVHGMALASIIGRGDPRLVDLAGRAPIIEPANVALIGVRDIDNEEKANVRDSGVQVFTMRDVDELGMRRVVESALGQITQCCSRFHVSIDMDFLDPLDAPGVGTPCPGGVTYREGHLAMEMIADAGCMCSFEVVEVNPILDAANATSRLAVELTLSAFGKRIF